MQEREKIFYVVITVLVFTGGFFIYRQKSEIRSLKGDGIGVTSQTNNQSFNQAEETKKQAMAAMQINGVVKEVGGDFLTVEATLIDVLKLEDFDFSKQSLLPSVKKDYKVFVDRNTDIISANAPFKFSDIKKGYPIQAFSDDEIYSKNKFTASRLHVFSH